MQVQVHTDNHIAGHQPLIDQVTTEVQDTLERFRDQITRVEVHLHDQNGPKHGATDKRCLMEARLAGHQPLVASHDAATLDDAITGAATKLEHIIEHTIDKLGHKKGRTSFGGDQTI